MPGMMLEGASFSGGLRVAPSEMTFQTKNPDITNCFIKSHPWCEREFSGREVLKFISVYA